jgi:septum formation protein
MDRPKHPLILASASPQRRVLLRKLGIPFRIIPSGVAENMRERSPRRLVVALARKKAVAIARKRPGALVLGADTIVWRAGRIIVKPKNGADSLRILRFLNGRKHWVYTGAALAWDGGRRVLSGAAASAVYARRLSRDELARLAGKHGDKAGGYAVQDQKDPFISRVSGDRDNVIGLPLKLVRALMRRYATGSKK